MKNTETNSELRENKLNNKFNNLLNNTMLFFIGSLGSKFIQFILVPLYTYTLTTTQYGITEIVITTVNILIPIFSISISDGFLRFGLNKEYDKEKVTSATIKILIFGSILSILFTPVFKINESLSKYLFLFILILNLRMYRDVLAIRLKIYNKNKLFAIDGILYTLVLCISNFILLVCFKLEINGYLLSYIIANVFSIVFICISSKLSIKIIYEKVDRKILKKMIAYSLPMIVNGVAWWITNASDKFMLEWFMTESDVGIYSIATKLPTFVTTFTSIFNQAWIISSVIEFDNEKDKRFYSETFRKYYGIIFLTCATLLLFIKPFIRIYVSQEYYIAWKYAPILIASATSSGIAAFTVGIYAASMKNINVTLTTVVGGIINIILNYVLIPKVGIMGAAIATYVSWTIIAIIRLIDIRKFFKFYINYKRILIYVILLNIQVLAITVVDDILSIIISTLVTILFIILERNLIKIVSEIILSKLRSTKIRKIYKDMLRRRINKNNIRRLKNTDFTIISSNCIGGVIYHELGIQFQSPTINMYMNSKDFIKFCKNLKFYLEQKIELINQNERNYPVVKLNDITLYCVHYKNFEEVEQAWNKRIKRVNFEKIAIIMSERDGCTYEDIIEFDKLQYKNKVIFVHKDMPEIKSAYYIKNTELDGDSNNKIIGLTEYEGRYTGKRYIDEFDYVDFLNKI
ncbi:MAG: DUF1919 domain-containing protein [Clostridia bacterium]|nr:DUF1919 domain-containing protein [Clostridia bacterium]